MSTKRTNTVSSSAPLVRRRARTGMRRAADPLDGILPRGVGSPAARAWLRQLLESGERAAQRDPAGAVEKEGR